MGMIDDADRIGSQYDGWEEYKEQNQKILTGTCITTHAKILTTPTDTDTIIIDEDPTNTLLSVVAVPHRDLVDFERYIKDEETRSNLSEMCMLPGEMRENEIKLNQSLSDVIVDHHQNRDSELSPADLIGCTHYIYSVTEEAPENGIIYAVKYKKLPASKKIIIMSATLREDFARLLFGNRLIWLEAGQVEHKGLLQQDIQRSFSLSRMANIYSDPADRRNRTADKIISQLKESDVYTITYKKYTDSINSQSADQLHRDEGSAWFGSTSGFNLLSGKDLNVLGTPRQPDEVVALIAHVTSNHNIPMATRIKMDVSINGYLVSNYWTYRNPHLRTVDLQFTEAELLQAVGLARINRYDCKVCVYSQLPQAKMFTPNITFITKSIDAEFYAPAITA